MTKTIYVLGYYNICLKLIKIPLNYFTNVVARHRPTTYGDKTTNNTQLMSKHLIKRWPLWITITDYGKLHKFHMSLSLSDIQVFNNNVGLVMITNRYFSPFCRKKTTSNAQLSFSCCRENGFSRVWDVV